MSEVLVTMDGIEKSFPGVHALTDCQFELRSLAKSMPWWARTAPANRR